MATVLITGGTGLVGKALTATLISKGYSCIILSRSPRNGTNGIRYAVWDPAAGTLDPSAIQEADYIVHLAGAGVAEKRWSAARKKEILDSRVKSGQVIVNSLRQYPHKVKAVLSASAIGWYGADPVIPNPRPFTEDLPADNAFLGDTCRQWEASMSGITEMGIRRLTFRIGIVLSREGGALKEFLKPLQFGVGAVLGNGRQVVSWIHRDDLVRLFIEGIENAQWDGIYNAVAPHPVSNKALTLALAKARKRFYILLPVPAFVLKLVMGEMSIEVLKSATVSAEKLVKNGFHFTYPDIETAMVAETTHAR